MDIINGSLKRGIFSDELKLAEVIPLFEKDDPFDQLVYFLIFPSFMKE